MLPPHVASASDALLAFVELVETYCGPVTPERWRLLPERGPATAGELRYHDVPLLAGPGLLTFSVSVVADERPVRVVSYSLQVRSGSGDDDRLLWRLCDHPGEEHRAGGRSEHLHLGDDKNVLPSPVITWPLLHEGLAAAMAGAVPAWHGEP